MGSPSGEIAVDAATVEAFGGGAFFRRLVENTSEALISIDETSTVVFANPAIERVFGFEPAELVGESLLRVMPERLRDRHRAALKRYLETGERQLDWNHVELPGLHRDGHELELGISFREIDRDDRRLFVGIVRDLSERKARQQELANSRDELERLARINTIVRDVFQVAVGATSREEIEWAVCERLSRADAYGIAWIGTVDQARGSIQPSAWAGMKQDDLADRSIAFDDESTEAGPIGRAVRTRRVQVAQGAEPDSGSTIWRAVAPDHDPRSAAAIPLVYEDRFFAVLTIYSDRPEAFGEREQAVLAELGSAIGHALSALERRDALLSEHAVQLEFRSRELARPFVAAAEGSMSTTVERSVVLDDETLVQYYTVEGVRPEEFVEEMAEEPRVTKARLVSRHESTCTVEVRSSGPTMAAALARHGGRITEIYVEDEHLRIRVEIPQSAEVRQVTAAVKEVYPDLELVSRRTVELESPPSPEIRTTIEQQVTDRQLKALELAYHGGYFNWPRDTTGQELAETMDVSPSTFHQHLRTGEQKLLGTFFDDRELSE